MILILVGLVLLSVFAALIGMAICRVSAHCARQEEREFMELLRKRELVKGDELEG